MELILLLSRCQPFGARKNRDLICLYIMSYVMPLAVWGNRFRDRGWARIDIQPIRHIRAHEEVVRQLRALMEREVLRTGDRLPSERELAKQFGVSRVTVRQALSVLQAMGLIESRIGNGTFARAGHKALSVTDLASALRTVQGNLTEQLELRKLIEPQVAWLAAERATDADLDELLRYISLQEARLSEGVPFVEEDGAFHLAIAQATKNSLLVKMVEGIQELLRESHEHSMRASGGMQLSLEGHTRVYRAIRDHEAQAAYDAMLAHILDVERLILQLLARNEADAGRRDSGS
jgi:GntR family transcriptional regulator, transcriptional repressor for pyruvate dehydrogenase complex